jgi:choice-of-anchor B domain-containing protein
MSIMIFPDSIIKRFFLFSLAWMFSAYLYQGGALAMDRMGGDLNKFIDPLVSQQRLTIDQATYITNHCIEEQFALDAQKSHALSNQNQNSFCAKSMINYLNVEVMFQRMTRETADYIALLFRLDSSGDSASSSNSVASHYLALSNHPVSRSYYQGNGVAKFLGSASFSPPKPGTDERYNGIWGYATGSREYVLQCHSKGLDILDVTDPDTSITRVQFIPMTGGEIWRDVETFQASNGKTYAYAGAQKGVGPANLWVIDLSYLSGSTRHDVDSNPIPTSAMKDLGETDNSHTLNINQELGLLSLNSANPSNGCRIFDLTDDPMQPRYLASHSGLENDCHDSLMVPNFDVPGMGPRDVLISADGYSGLFRLVDITDIRTSGGGSSTLTVLGETQRMGSYAYAHSVAFFTRGDKKYLVVFDETNSYDIAIHDVTDPAKIVLLGTFQYSDGGTTGGPSGSGGSYVHNGHALGNYLMVAYYEAGFRVFDLTNPSNVVEAGMYATYQADSSVWTGLGGGANGAWNLYVHFPSGNIAISDQQSGTFIVGIDESGGPSHNPLSSPSPTPTSVGGTTPPPPSPPQQCTDIPGWYSLHPFFDCGFFALYGCYDYFGGFGHTADTACCECGGGTYPNGSGDDDDDDEEDDTAPPTPSPTSTTPSDDEGFYVALMNMGTETRYDAHFASAAARWRSMLLPTKFPPVPAGTVNDLFDGFFSTPVDVDVDYLLTGYSIEYIDGYGGILGFAGPTIIMLDENTRIPKRSVAGVMKFDAEDFAVMSDNDIEIVILHEMAHVFGIGTFWDLICGVRCSQGDTSYTCPEAKIKYQELGFSSNLRLETGVCGHFSESSFSSYQSSELMTPIFEAYKEQPVSVVTLGALKDIGFEVLYEMADDYGDSQFRHRNLRPNNIFREEKNTTTLPMKKWSPLRPTSTFSLEGRVSAPGNPLAIRL